ncbi:MAG: porin, partial [Alistipes sp.]
MIRYEVAFANKHMKFGVAAEMPSVSGTYGDAMAAIPQRMPDFPIYLQVAWGANRTSHLRA